MTPSPQTTHQETDILIIGAGPAGLAAAIAASTPGRRVLVLDESPAPGGQIWRPSLAPEKIRGARRRLLRHFAHSRAELLPGRRVIAATPTTVQTLTETSTTPETFHTRSLILATGARERFLPFPGWTLPGVFGAGGLQALVRSGLAVGASGSTPAKRVVVAGTGPLLVAVAAHLRRDGAHIAALTDQAPLAQVIPFALHLARRPARLLQSLGLATHLRGIRPRFGTWPVAAHGTSHLEAVTLTNGRRRWRVPCDYLACGFHLVPNTELALLLGCQLTTDPTPAVHVDPLQQTSIPGVFCAGEPTGIAGVDAAILSGRIAGLAATGNTQAATRLIPRARAERRFGQRIDRAFQLRPELRTLPDLGTVVCRCEDVTYGTLAALHHAEDAHHNTFTDAKLLTRCGMGACQGRVCGPAVHTLFGWHNTSVRPPLYPVPLAAFTSAAAPTPIPPETIPQEPL